jgi:hypothetical protein
LEPRLHSRLANTNQSKSAIATVHTLSSAETTRTSPWPGSIPGSAGRIDLLGRMKQVLLFMSFSSSSRAAPSAKSGYLLLLTIPGLHTLLTLSKNGWRARLPPSSSRSRPDHNSLYPRNMEGTWRALPALRKTNKTFRENSS